MRYLFCLFILFLYPHTLRAASYAEPSTADMKQALMAAMHMRGGKIVGNKIVSENAISGASIEIVDFEKLGCSAPVDGAGYICNYRIESKMLYHSNEGTRAGNNHAAGLNQFTKFFNQGRDTVQDITKRLFLKSKQGWISSEE